MGHVPIAQSYITGRREYGFFALCDNGEPVVTFQHRRVRSYTYAGGASSYRVSVDISALEAAGTRLLRELDWHGPAMVEFKYDPQRAKLVLLEVNPRFWGSLALAKAAGINFPYKYFRLAAGDIGQTTIDYDVGVGCHFIQGELSYLHSVLFDEYAHLETPLLRSTVWNMATSILDQSNFDYLSADDPGPFVYNVATAVVDLVKNISDGTHR